jgi:hypothetical protein
MYLRSIGISAALALTLAACGHSPFRAASSNTRAPAATGQAVTSAAPSLDGRPTGQQTGLDVNFSPRPTQGEQTGVDTNYRPTQGEQTGVDTNYRPSQGEQTGVATNYLRQ